MKGATKPPPQNKRLKFRFLAAISSLVGGGGRSFKLKERVDDSIAGPDTKFPTPCCRLDVAVVAMGCGATTLTSTAAGRIGANADTTERIADKTRKIETPREIMLGIK